MALTERQRSRMRNALDHVLQAEEVVAAVADDLARLGQAEHDAALDQAAALLAQLVTMLEPLAGGRARRE